MEQLVVECLCIDARDPARLGRFWAGVLEAEVVEESAARTRVANPGVDGFYLDFRPVPDREKRPHRLHLDLNDVDGRGAMVERALGLGAEPVDIGQGDAPWTVLVDPEDYAFCVMPDRRMRDSGEPMYPDSGPIGGIPIDADDIDAAATFWSALWDWQPWPPLPGTFRHPSGTGPLIGVTDPVEPKRGKNPMHLDVRVRPGGDYDAQLARLRDLGARRLEHDWGDLPWTVLLDPGNNEFCLLRPQSAVRTPTTPVG